MISALRFSFGSAFSRAFIVLAVLAGVLSVAAVPSSAAEAGGCSFERELVSGNVAVTWDATNLKRAHLRSPSGWIATIQAPDASLTLVAQPNDRTYFLIAKSVGGQTSRIDCTEYVAPAGPCTYTNSAGSVRVEWDLDDIKRVNVRHDGGWLATVSAPQATVSVEVQRQATNVFLRAKTNGGRTSTVVCDEVIGAPSIGVDVRPSDGPVCVASEAEETLIRLYNAFGSVNLRDSNGWVQKLKAPVYATVPAGESYAVVVRNPISGREDTPCTGEHPESVEKVWGGTKATLAPNLQLEHDDFKIVEMVPGRNDGYQLVNKQTGAALDLYVGVDWYVTGVSADGMTLLAKDSDDVEYDYEIHLSSDHTSFTYYRIG